jgi:hypothetical protein
MATVGEDGGILAALLVWAFAREAKRITSIAEVFFIVITGIDRKRD